MKVVYPNTSGTEIRSRLQLRSTVRGANNRLDLMSLVSYDRAAGSAVSLTGAHLLLGSPPSRVQEARSFKCDTALNPQPYGLARPLDDQRRVLSGCMLCPHC